MTGSLARNRDRRGLASSSSLSARDSATAYLQIKSAITTLLIVYSVYDQSDLIFPADSRKQLNMKLLCILILVVCHRMEAKDPEASMCEHCLGQDERNLVCGMDHRQRTFTQEMWGLTHIAQFTFLLQSLIPM